MIRFSASLDLKYKTNKGITWLIELKADRKRPSGTADKVMGLNIQAVI